MPIQRQTSRIVKISDITQGEWVKKEGMEPSYVLTSYGEPVSRARIMGTIVGKFVSEDGSFASITLDDSTDTIRAKVFKDLKPLEKSIPGQLVDVIGKVREYNEEIYLIAENVKEVNPNLEILRKLEILNKMKNWKKPKVEAQPKKDNKKEPIRKEILKLLDSGEISFTDLISRVKGEEALVEKVIDEILSEGICYEPTPGKIKKI